MGGFEYLTRTELLLLYVFLRIVLCDVCRGFPSLTNEFFKKKVIGCGLHVVSVGLNEAADLLWLKTLLAILCGKLHDNFLV